MARLEGMRMFLALVAYRDFKVFQMDVKLGFLNGNLEEEVYIKQPDGFKLCEDTTMVCKLRRALYVVNVDDIIFGVHKNELCKELANRMEKEFEMSTLGEVAFFLGLQVKQLKSAVCMVARFQSSPKETHVVAVKRILKYLKGSMEHGLWYPRKKNFELTAYSNANWEGCVDDRKSSSGGAFYLGESLVA
ncbi:secreted RxLR effector protein 161-like [Telopea speciosissima]|uniref:secreted RxLR effector protein 161-like n=1 Tax=Telopea speciosissima TaxID=54955 RepID=UPI001CC5B3A2|nr:secreted RxLR effector protein 161-like [Telopea speciosissima]